MNLSELTSTHPEIISKAIVNLWFPEDFRGNKS